MTTAIVDRLLRAANEAVEERIRGIAAGTGIDVTARRTCTVCGVRDVAGWVADYPGGHLVVIDRPTNPRDLDLRSDGARVRMTVTIELGLCAWVSTGFGDG